MLAKDQNNAHAVVFKWLKQKWLHCVCEDEATVTVHVHELREGFTVDVYVSLRQKSRLRDHLALQKVKLDGKGHIFRASVQMYIQEEPIDENLCMSFHVCNRWNNQHDFSINTDLHIVTRTWRWNAEVLYSTFFYCPMATETIPSSCFDDAQANGINTFQRFLWPFCFHYNY